MSDRDARAAMNTVLKDGSFMITACDDGSETALVTVRGKDHDFTPEELLEMAESLVKTAKFLDHREEQSQIIFVLRTPKTGGELDGYVFQDEAHSIGWMAQPCAREGYHVERWLAREVPCPCRRGLYWEKLRRAEDCKP